MTNPYLMTLCLAMVAVSSLSMPLVAQSQTPKKPGIVVEGFGKTRDDALKDAFRNAIRQAVGAIVEAETIIENDRIIEEKILTYSDAIIEKYEELSESGGLDNGSYRVRIRAVVGKSRLEKRLREANVEIGKVDGSGLFSKLVTDAERESNAAALLARQLEGFPEAYLKTRVIGKPQLINKSDNTATMDFLVETSVDLDAYKKFADRINKVLNDIGLKPIKFKQGFVKHTGNSFKVINDEKPLRDLLTALEYTGDERIKAKPLVIASNTSGILNCYALPEKLYTVLDNTASKVLDVKLVLLDKDNEAIEEKSCICRSGLDNYRTEDINYNGTGIFFKPSLIDDIGMTEDRSFTIIPVFISKNVRPRCYSSIIVCRLSLEMDLKRIQAISSTKIELYPIKEKESRNDEMGGFLK